MNSTESSSATASADLSNAKSRSTSGEWRLDVPDQARRPVRVWLWIGAALVFLMLVVGGITRLTDSGLSMVNWRPLMGAIPPLTHAQWQDVFEQYKQFPEYQQLNQGMSLSEFQYIFFWEYLHRLIARVLGLVFIGPFAWFWYKGYFTRPLMKRVLGIFGLGALQGLMGWFMVKSGLVNVPYVSHFRLAAHLMLAFAIIASCVWVALDLTITPNKAGLMADVRKNLKSWMRWIGVLLILQIVWGAFVAGLNAGFMFNTFPTMLGDWIPQQIWQMTPLWANFFDNPVAVQWTHRILGTVLGVVIILLWIRNLTLDTEPGTNRRITMLMVTVLAQYLLGVYTLLYAVPVALGVIHQAVAMVLWVVWLATYHYLMIGTHPVKA